MLLHPQVAQFLELWKASAAKPMEHSSPLEIRANMCAGIVQDTVARNISSINDQQTPGPGGEIPIRIYRGSAACPQSAVVFLHGGGWVAGNIQTHDVLCRALTEITGQCVISVDYRLAPEHRFPAAAEDAYAVTQWVHEHAVALRIDPKSIAIAGDSAGGNLAAVVTLMARERQGHLPSRQVLIYPVIDAACVTPSFEQFAQGYLLTRSAMQWFWQQYAPQQIDRDHPYASPCRATHFSGLPPALIITAECDVLRDEGERYSEKLLSAGVPTTLVRVEGMIHGFVHRVAVFDESMRIIHRIAEFLRIDRNSVLIKT